MSEDTIKHIVKLIDRLYTFCISAITILCLFLLILAFIDGHLLSKGEFIVAFLVLSAGNVGLLIDRRIWRKENLD